MLALWGIGDLMVIFMAVAARRTQGAVRGGGAGRRRRLASGSGYVTLPNISPIIMFAVVTGVIQTMQYYTQPLVAGKVASGVIGRRRARTFDAGYPDGSTLTLPQLVYNARLPALQHGAACVVALVLFALSMAFTALLLRRGAGFLSAED